MRTRASFPLAFAGTVALLGAPGCRHESEASGSSPHQTRSTPASDRTRDRTRDAVEPAVVADGPAPHEKHPNQPEGTDSGGSLKLPFVRASRENCVSPCAVMFSIDPVQDTSTDNPFALSGVYWDYADPEADTREGPYTHGAQKFRTKKGPSRASDTNTPMGMHVYRCESEVCTFHPGVSVRNAAGDWATAWTTVLVRAPSLAFPKERTVCVSSSGAWDGDIPCPEGADQVPTLPTLGSWKSNTRYLLRRGETFVSERSCIGYGRHDIQIASFGRRSDPKPTLTRLAIGRGSSCANAVTDDRKIGSYQPRFWNEDITLTDLRVEAIELGMTFKDITMHELDMDHEDGPRGGSVMTEATDRCTGDPRLSCERVPLPQGLYIVGTELVGSRKGPPKYNVGMLRTTCASFVGLLDSRLEVAMGHNMRLECSSRVLALHSDINGHHLGEPGRKNVAPRVGLTVRADGNLGRDMLGQMRRASKDPSQVYESRYTAVKDVYFGNPDSSNHSARVTVMPSKAQEPAITRMAVLSGNVVDLTGGKGSGPSSFDARLAGRGLVCYDDNEWQAPQGCGDRGKAAIPEGGYDPARTSMAPPQVPEPPATYGRR